MFVFVFESCFHDCIEDNAKFKCGDGTLSFCFCFSFSVLLLWFMKKKIEKVSEFDCEFLRKIN